MVPADSMVLAVPMETPSSVIIEYSIRPGLYRASYVLLVAIQCAPCLEHSLVQRIVRSFCVLPLFVSNLLGYHEATDGGTK